MSDEADRLWMKADTSRTIVESIKDKLTADYGSAMTTISNPYGFRIDFTKTDGTDANLQLQVASQSQNIRIAFTENLVTAVEAGDENKVKATIGECTVVLFHNTKSRFYHGGRDPLNPAAERQMTYIVETLLYYNWP